MTDRISFDDPISGQACVLVIPADGRVYPAAGEPKIGIEHPGCPYLADLTVHLDCFYCPVCRLNGRLSGAWAIDEIEQRS